ncbi:MBL fold metallo-hydrolase [Leifsonia aquatica]|uniref:MBL fold metallo-hydrolase n=1 Tax=Leifsonia aquatica TaxID=144185 RepID=UPI0028AE4EE1|nr:MBL fold metallo-hydrolase [Leifsonia aquatica]
MPTNPYPSRTVGDYTITAVSDGHLTADIGLLVNIDPAEASALQQRGGASADAPMHINSFVIRGAGRCALMDAGAGGVKGWGGHLLAGLSRAGVEAADIDTVLLTHAHPDHVGGLLDRDGRAAFPHAELRLDPRELAFWMDDANLARANERARGNFRLAREVLAAYAGSIRPIGADEVLPSVTAVPLFGHTGGHTGYLVPHDTDGVFFWGDTVHFPAVQIARPEASVALDDDPVRAAHSRIEVVQMLSSDSLIAAGAHLGAEGFARVERSRGGYRLTDAA